MAGNVAPKIIYDSSLVLYLDAANRSSYPGSGTTWYDLTTTKNDATLVNSPIFDPTANGCFSFNGTTQYATINSSTSITTATPTIIVTCTTSTGTVLAKGGYGTYWNYGLLGLTSTNYKVRQQSQDPTSPTFAATTSTFNAYAVAWDGTNIQWYRNGAYRGGSSSGYSPFALNALFLRIGCAWNNNTTTNVEYYSGKIATIQIYNRALSATEIQQNYNALRSRFGL